MPSSSSAHLHQLHSLADQPAQQASYAVTLLNPRLGYEVIQSALLVLSKTSAATARPALLKLYDHYDKNGKDRDPAANLRAATMRALRHVVEPADVPLLARAAMTFVFPPPAFKEEGALLRSAALTVLNEVDDLLARYHAVRLLANEHTDPMSGEPALTAVRLLAGQAEITPLYFYLMQDGARVLPEVLAECLRHLTRLPDVLIPGLIERYGDNPHAVVLVGLFDLLLTHQSGPHGQDMFATFLRTTQQLDVYRYLVTMLMAAGRQELLDLVLAVAHAEQHPEKVTILVKALAVMEGIPAINTCLKELRSRLARRPSRPHRHSS